MDAEFMPRAKLEADAQLRKAREEELAWRQHNQGRVPPQAKRRLAELKQGLTTQARKLERYLLADAPDRCSKPQPAFAKANTDAAFAGHDNLYPRANVGLLALAEANRMRDEFCVFSARK
jgi:hypothetical protein